VLIIFKVRSEAMFGGVKGVVGNVISFLKVSFLIMGALFLPRFFLLYASPHKKTESQVVSGSGQPKSIIQSLPARNTALL
jgi:hypothetical protein